MYLLADGLSTRRQQQRRFLGLARNVPQKVLAMAPGSSTAAGDNCSNEDEGHKQHRDGGPHFISMQGCSD
jgi:hypothetical protein